MGAAGDHVGRAGELKEGADQLLQTSDRAEGWCVRRERDTGKPEREGKRERERERTARTRRSERVEVREWE